MAHELVDEVTATPAGPFKMVLGQSIAVTGSYTLNGAAPGSPTTSHYAMNFSYVGPGVPSSWGNVDPAVHETDYTVSYTPAYVGEHYIDVNVYYQNDVPYQAITHSNVIVLTVRNPAAEDVPPTPGGSEMVPPGAGGTEQPPASGSSTEESPPT